MSRSVVDAQRPGAAACEANAEITRLGCVGLLFRSDVITGPADARSS